MLRVHLRQNDVINSVPVPSYGFDPQDMEFVVPYYDDGRLVFGFFDTVDCFPCGKSYNAPCPYCEE